MEFGTTPTRKSAVNGHINVIQDSECGDDISFYSFPPTGKIDLLEVDEMVDERLSILEVFDELKISEAGQAKNLADHLGTIRERLKQVSSKYGDNFITTLHARTLGAHNTLKIDARRRDQISHFLLRLYFCHPQDKKNWFVSRETDLLRYRLLEETVNKPGSIDSRGSKKDASVVANMIKNNGLNYEPILLGNSDADRELKRKVSFNSIFVVNDDKSPIYRIEFEDALDVIRTRKAYLYNGYAYVTTHDMISLICTKFRQELNTALSRLYMVRLSEENRLLPLINKIYLQKVASARKLKADASGKLREVITPDMIDGLALEHFPPCMENIHLSLRKNHHIKYGGRLHYGLFLKGIGLSLEDAIKFFRDEFIQKIPPEKFDKEYRYGIRYNYGKEGKKVDFSPYGCEKIISSTPGTGDAHGCPFKHFDLAMLKKFLSRKGINDEVLSTIETLVEEKNYSRACSLYFTVRHPGHHLSEEGITHPNSFYSESRKALARNPKREDIMVDEEIDHILDPEEISFLSQNVSTFKGEPMDANETENEKTTEMVDESSIKKAIESENMKENEVPGDCMVVENDESVDISSSAEIIGNQHSQEEIETIEETDETIGKAKLSTIIEPLDDEPMEKESETYNNEPEQ